MSSQSLNLYISDYLSFKERFIYLMHLLVLNQSSDRFEIFFFLGIFSLQNISIYFTDPAGVLNKNNICDNFLFQIARIIRFKALLFYNRTYYNFAIYILACYYFLFTILYLVLIIKTNRKTTYTPLLHFLNFFIKVNIYILSNIIIDFFTRMLCFNQTYNSNIIEIKCDQSNNLKPLIICFSSSIYSSITCIFIHYFYEDNFLLSYSNFNSITSRLFLLQHLKAIIDSFLLGLISELTHDFFFILNILSSSLVFYYYINRLVYYKQSTNHFYGMTYFMNLYTSIYFYIFYHVDSSQKGLIYLISIIMVAILFIIIINNLTIKLVKSIPYYKISNPYFLLFYVNFILSLSNQIEDNQESKSLLKALIEMHAIECPSEKCITKNNMKIYLPKLNQWSDRKIPFIYDQIFLKNFILYIIRYFLVINNLSPELLINLSHYYLNIIGNTCLSIYYYNRAKEMQLNIQERFLLERLKINISNKLCDNFKTEGEVCSKLIEMDPTLYFKYHNLGDKFINEIKNDLDLLIEFWEIFSIKKNPKLIDFKIVFLIIEKIKRSKDNIEDLWKELYDLYPGIDQYFYIYMDYVNEINDNSNLKNELEIIKRRKENMNENIINNYYNILFNEDTGIIIVNGEKGKEGIIEKANIEFGKIFHCNPEKIRGKRINEFMSKVFSIHHCKFMKDYYNIGEKKIIDKAAYKIYALDSSNSIIQLQKYLKIYPILNENIHYIAMLTLDKVDDIIILNQNFMIQGISHKLKEQFNINNKNLFIYNDIPFYMICKNFINFYKIFFKENKKLRNTILLSHRKSVIEEEEENQLLLNENLNINMENISNTEFCENIEINENMEIEYEIKIPEFLIKYSYYTKHLDYNSNESSIENTFVNDDTYINCRNSSLIKKERFRNETIEESQNFIDEKSTHLNLQINNFITPSSTPMNYSNYSYSKPNFNLLSTDYSLFRNENGFRKTKLDYQMNGRRNIYLFKSLFDEERYDELEQLFELNTEKNYISYRFNFSFERINFNNNYYYYLIRCIDNNKEKDSNTDISDSNLLSLCNNQILKDKINSLQKLDDINNEEKKIFDTNIKNFFEILNNNEILKKNIKQNYTNIKLNSRIHGENFEDNTSTIFDESASQTSTSSFNNDLSKLNKIIESRNKILQNKITSSKTIYLKFFTFLILFTVLLFFIFYENEYEKIIIELDNVREYNNILFSAQLTLIKILNYLIDYSVIFYNNFYNYNIKINFTYDTEEEFINDSTIKINIWYKETMEKINYLERYVLKYVPDPINKVWFKVVYQYQIEVPWNNSDYFPVIAKNSLYDTYFLFNEKDLFDTAKKSDINSDTYFLVDYTTYMSINGIMKYALPKFIDFIPLLLEDYLNYSDRLFINFEFIIIFYSIFDIIVFFGMGIITFLTISQLNFGITKVTKISQDNVENIIGKIKIFKETLNEKINNANKIYSMLTYRNYYYNKKSESDNIKSSTRKDSNIKKSKNNRLSNKTFAVTYNNINVNNKSSFSLDRQKINKIVPSRFISIYYIINFILIIFFIFVFYCIPHDLIICNSNLLKSHTYILEKFLYTTTYLFQMKYLFANYSETFILDLKNIVNESLSSCLYDTLPKFQEFNNFYYKAFLLDACLALYDYSNENYTNCVNNSIIQLTNNTDAINNLIIKKIDSLIYNFNYSSYSYEDFNSYVMFTKNEYIEINSIFSDFYINVYDRFNNIIKNAFHKKSNYIKFYTDIVLIILVFWSLANIFYQYFIYLPYFKKMIKISTHFIQIIPSSFILDTPDLENWLEKTDSG